MVRFLADASLRNAIVRGCLRREPTMDFLSANRANLEGVPDPAVLAFAAQQGRVLVTSDFKTMPGYFGEFLQGGGSSPGVFLVKQHAPIAEVIDSLVLVWAASGAEERRDRIVEIPAT